MSLARIRLSESHQFKPFDCDTSDLNDFLLNSAKDHQSKLLAVTYMLEDDSQTIAFYSLLNDKIGITEFGGKTNWFQRVLLNMPESKRYRSYPAMKLGRLGVHKSVQRKGIGKEILDYLKIWFITNNKTGCKFITVDALKESIDFYIKNGFEFLTVADENNDSRQMYFDLSILTNTAVQTTE